MQIKTLGIAIATCFGGALFGGSIITSGLPANTAIVNISATADGSANYNSAGSPTASDPYQTYWYSPFNTSSTLLTYTVQPGTYYFRIVNPTDAAALYPGLSSADLGSIYTAWTYNTPWVTDYLVFNLSAASNSSEYQLFTGAVTPVAHYPGFVDAATAYSTAKSEGYFDDIVTGVGGRYNGTTTTSYTFASATTLVFAIPDNVLGDNTGGVSVLISQVPAVNTGVPEPGSIVLMMTGIAALLTRRIRG